MQYLTDRMGAAEARDRKGLELVAANAFFTASGLAASTSLASVRRLIAGGLIAIWTDGGVDRLDLTSKGREVVERSWRVW